jgi:hypothetical protein
MEYIALKRHTTFFLFTFTEDPREHMRMKQISLNEFFIVFVECDA